jgi:hypothetical protein
MQPQEPQPLLASRSQFSDLDGLAMAGALMTLVGFFDLVNGTAAMLKATYIVDHLIVGDIVTWGVIMASVGILAMLMVFPLGLGHRWAAAGAVVVTLASTILQVNCLRGPTAWSILMLVSDVVLVGLLAAFAWPATRQSGS